MGRSRAVQVRAGLAGVIRSLKASIRRRQAAGFMPVLSEIKVCSPREGDLMRGRAPERLAEAMGACPVAGLAVVTGSAPFGGELDLIRRVRPLVDVPILRRDCVRDEGGVDETLAAGADVLLLAVNQLSDGELARTHAAAQARGLETLVEVHEEDDVDRLDGLGLRPDIVGINNRDIRIGEVDDGDVTTTERLAGVLDPGTVLLSGGAIASLDDAIRAKKAGADVILVGTSILRAPDPVAMIQALVEVGWP